MLGRGEAIGGFQIQEVLRSGPRGVVYEAVEGGSGRVVALRVLDLRLSHDPAFVERFRQQEWPEHPHIVSVFEAGEWDHGLFVAPGRMATGVGWVAGSRPAKRRGSALAQPRAAARRRRLRTLRAIVAERPDPDHLVALAEVELGALRRNPDQRNRRTAPRRRTCPCAANVVTGGSAGGTSTVEEPK